MTAALGTVEYSRTVKVRDYESAKATVAIQFEIPAMNGDTAAHGQTILAAAQTAMFQAKTLVFDELGIKFNVDEGGVIREAIRSTFGQVTEVSAPATPMPVTAPPVAIAATSTPMGSTNPPFDARTQDAEQKRANAKWAKDRFSSNPDEFYDNRDKKASGEYSPKSPDFKHKDSGIGVWLS